MPPPPSTTSTVAAAKSKSTPTPPTTPRLAAPSAAAPASKRQKTTPSDTTATSNTLLSVPDGLRRKPSAGILTTSTTSRGTRTAHITTTAAVVNSTSSAPKQRSTSNPLRLHGQDAPPTPHAVKPRRPSVPKPLNLSAATMPSYDRPATTGTRQPTVARVSSKTPVTPKLASRTPAGQHHAPPLASPFQKSSSSLATSNSRDDLMSPVSAFLSSNVTPRSSSRQSRVDSANSTPAGTPLADRSDAWETRSGIGGLGLDDAPRKPVLTLSPASEVGGPSRQDKDSKFFYASEAQKPAPSQSTSSRPPSFQGPKISTFFYANGETVADRPHAAPRPFSPPMNSPASQESKFVYANGTPELQPPAKIGPTPKVAGSVVGSAKVTTRQGNTPRSNSPNKPALATSKSAGPSVAVSPRSPGATSPRPTVDYSSTRPKSHVRTKSASVVELPVNPRRFSGQGPLSSSGNTSPSNPPRHAPILAGSQTNNASAGFASLLQAAEDFAAEADEHSDSHTDESHHESHNNAAKPAPDPVDELVANARRERKVQDLEITNASLEAINRTLERQLRKQTAELRRYQRLSRAGRLSIGSMGSVGSAPSTGRVSSDSVAVEGGALAQSGISLNDLSEEDENESDEDHADMDHDLDESDDDDLSSEASEEAPAASDTDTAAASTSVPAEEGGEANPTTKPADRPADARQEKRRRDERRLQLDLSKHQQLLRDSQRMNQSLKRCLGWTEELIKEGRRALSYQVRVSDVSLGGRVLAPEEVERRQRAAERGDETETDAGLLEEDETIYAIDALGKSVLVGGESVDGDLETEAETDAGSIPPATWGKDAQDRDSGIELATDAC